MGAGKGRIVLAAYAFPFIDVIGVENTPMLCRIAEKNLIRCRFLRQVACEARIVECDATEFVIPETPSVFFFYNPFNFETTNMVIRNIVDSFDRLPRDIYLVFVGISTMFDDISRIPTLYLQSSFDIPWGRLTKRTVSIFMIRLK